MSIFYFPAQTEYRGILINNTTERDALAHLQLDWWVLRLSLSVVGIMSATGNGYVIYMTIKRKTKLKPPELMTVNLAVFDFGISGMALFVVTTTFADLIVKCGPMFSCFLEIIS